jgi:hypothetical protein
MAESIAWARTTIAEAMPSASTITGGFAGGAGRISGMMSSTTSTAPPPRPAAVPSTTAPALAEPGAPVRASAPITTFAPASAPSSSPPPAVDPSLPIDAELAATFADRKAKIAVVSVEGPRMLRAGNWRRAAELCKAWTELELANAESYRCLGSALQAQGYHQDAINAFRKAKQYDPNDRSLDAAIDRSQKGIVADFLNRYRR